MMWQGLVLLSLVLSLEIGYSSADCPPKEVVSPCWCSYVREPFGWGNLIACGGDSKIDLKSVLKKVSDSRKKNQRHFFKLAINNQLIEEIPDNVVGNLTFDYITIIDGVNLKKIHSLAFSNTAKQIKYFTLNNSPKLSLLPAPHNLFDMLNSFENVKQIWIENVDISHLTSQVFKPLKSLNQVAVYNTSKSKSQFQVADKAFYNLDGLTGLYLAKHKIDHFAADAFKFSKESNQTLWFTVFQNNLNSSSFNSGWLNNINRPVIVNFYNNQITFLDQNAFKPFLDDKRNNRINDLRSNPLNCSDCRNAWVKKGKDKYERRVIYAYCDGKEGGKTIFDSNFDHCT